MNRLRMEFRTAVDGGQRNNGPYFIGYCGEHESDHPGIFQLADQGLCSSHCFLRSLQSYPKDCFLIMLTPIAVPE